jgi:hypothetical protein
MNRRQFLRSAISAAVVAALPLPALLDLPKPTNFTGQVGSFYNLRFIGMDLGREPSKTVMVARWNDRYFVAHEPGYLHYSAPNDDLDAFVRSLPEYES